MKYSQLPSSPFFSFSARTEEIFATNYEVYARIVSNGLVYHTVRKLLNLTP